MFSEHLPTSLWVDALIRRASGAGAGAFLVQKGDAQRGDILLKVANLRGLAKLYRPRTNLEGERVFLDLSAGALGQSEEDIDHYVSKACQFDTDLWLIEIEDPQMRSFLTESIEQ